MESEVRGIVNFGMAVRTILLILGVPSGKPRLGVYPRSKTATVSAGAPGMSRAALLCVSILLLCSFALLLSLNGCSGSKGVTITVPPPVPTIQHVVIIFQENRTPDNLFQGLCSANGGVSGCGTERRAIRPCQFGT